MKSILKVISLLGFVIISSTQLFGQYFQKELDISSEVQEAWDVCVTMDSGTAIIGRHEVVGNNKLGDVYVCKLDSLGHQEWLKFFQTGKEDIGLIVKQKANGKLIVAGESEGFSTYLSVPQTTIFVMQLSDSGTVDWCHYYNNPPASTSGPGNMGLADLIIAQNGDILMLSNTGNASGRHIMCVVRLDPSGNIVNSMYYGTSTGVFGWGTPITIHQGVSIMETNNGEVVVAFEKSDNTHTQEHITGVMSLNPSLSILWVKHYEDQTTSTYKFIPNRIIETQNQDFIVVGEIQDHGHNHQPYIIRLDASGNLQWSWKYETEFRFNDIIENFHHELIIAGERIIPIGSNPEATAIATKLDGSGHELWTTAYGYPVNPGDTNERFFALDTNKNNDIVLAGRYFQPNPTPSGISTFIVQTNEHGERCASDFPFVGGHVLNVNETWINLHEETSVNPVQKFTGSFTIIDDLFAENDRCSQSSSRISAQESEDIRAKIEMEIYPVPSSESINITGLDLQEDSFEIYTINSQSVQSVINYEINAGKLVIDISNLTKGIYLIRCEKAGQSHTMKFIKE